MGVRFPPPMLILNKTMEVQDYNKNGEVNRYTNLDEILRLDISDELRENFSQKFNKKVFFDYNGNCKIGTLAGIEVNGKLSARYYIIDTEDKKIYVPCENSLTLL